MHVYVWCLRYDDLMYLSHIYHVLLCHGTRGWPNSPDEQSLNIKLCASEHCRYNQLIWWLEHSRKERQTHTANSHVFSMKQHGRRPSWRRGLEILLDHWLHQCSGLPDSHSTRGVSTKRYQPTSYSWKMDDSYVGVALCRWRGNTARRTSGPWMTWWPILRPNKRSMVDEISLWNCRHSNCWQVLTVESADRAHVPEEGQKYSHEHFAQIKVVFVQILQVQLFCVKPSAYKRPYQMMCKCLLMFPRFASSFI